MRACAASDLDEARVVLRQLYGKEQHEQLFEKELQCTPRTFAPLVDAAFLASLNDAIEVRDEMIENVRCLSATFGVCPATVEAVKETTELLDSDNTSDEALALVRKKLEGTELAGHLRLNEYV